MKNGMEDLSRLEEYKKENPSQLTEEQFEVLEQEILYPKKGTISDARLDFRLWCEGGCPGKSRAGQWSIQNFAMRRCRNGWA